MESDGDIIEDVYGKDDDEEYFDEEQYEEYDGEDIDYADEESIVRESDEIDDYSLAEDISRLDTGAEWREKESPRV